MYSKKSQNKVHQKPTVHLISISSCLFLSSSAARYESPIPTCEASNFSPGPSIHDTTYQIQNSYIILTLYNLYNMYFSLN